MFQVLESQCTVGPNTSLGSRRDCSMYPELGNREVLENMNPMACGVLCRRSEWLRSLALVPRSGKQTWNALSSTRGLKKTEDVPSWKKCGKTPLGKKSCRASVFLPSNSVLRHHFPSHCSAVYDKSPRLWGPALSTQRQAQDLFALKLKTQQDPTLLSVFKEALYYVPGIKILLCQNSLILWPFPRETHSHP